MKTPNSDFGDAFLWMYNSTPKGTTNDTYEISELAHQRLENQINFRFNKLTNEIKSNSSSTQSELKKVRSELLKVSKESFVLLGLLVVGLLVIMVILCL